MIKVFYLQQYQHPEPERLADSAKWGHQDPNNPVLEILQTDRQYHYDNPPVQLLRPPLGVFIYFKLIIISINH